MGYTSGAQRTIEDDKGGKQEGTIILSPRSGKGTGLQKHNFVEKKGR